MAVVAAAGYLAGLVPGDSARATVDHCHVTYDRQEQQHSRCVGHWTRVGRVASGPVHGVQVSPRWQVLTVDPDANFEWEVDVPRSARRQVALAHQTRAYVVPGFVPVLLAVLSLVPVGFLGGTVVWRRLRPRTTG
ncbi:hypothetical protein U2F26_10045 [Micromonospora sp. 4G57]|uniref:DUF3592 domain-containing protein n=1 Tax=Micromonospora sicca TaxID=2202420 RepID=A0ABU5J6R0_9ACTN|nr:MULTISPECIES: hypothetical protein [unclassified Micromonospora]MDZ5443069.1 hypothetical protein [Micromonospora sp. 4G57]MDZ5488219.1 hypothetical protein [Micromonospora sp. 4G53]